MTTTPYQEGHDTPIKMIKALEDRIKDIRDQLTPRQRIVAEFFIQNPETIGFLSITNLAQKTGVSEATILRFCNTLGYKGYAQLGREVQESIQSELNSIGRFRLAYRSHRSIKNTPSAFERVLGHELDSLFKLSKTIKIEDFQRCIEWMGQAEQVIIVGCLASASLAQYFGFILAKLLPVVQAVSYTHLRAHET